MIDTIFTCPYCMSWNHTYRDIDINQLTLNDEIYKCKFCLTSFPLNKQNFSHHSKPKKFREINKMELEKQDVGGNFFKAEHIGQGNIGDKGIITFKGEGEKETANFGQGDIERLSIPIEINGTEKIFSVSPKNVNVLIDNLGKNTNDWVNKTVDVLVESCNVGKSGKQITVLEKV